MHIQLVINHFSNKIHFSIMKSFNTIIVVLLMFIHSLDAQTDSTQAMQLDAVDVFGNKIQSSAVKTLPIVHGTTITAGKKIQSLTFKNCPQILL